MNKKFTKDLRLRRPEEFRAVFRMGGRASKGGFVALSLLNQRTKPRLGVAVSKKKAGGVVQRNRLKRLIRETFRLSQEKLAHQDVVVFLGATTMPQKKKEVQLALNDIWNRLSEN